MGDERVSCDTHHATRRIMSTAYHDKLKSIMNVYVHDIYRVTKQFPKEEMYGSTSQLRRAALSVVLNYIEGFARFRPAVNRNFLEISYGSLQESKYFLLFAYEEGWSTKEQHEKLVSVAEEIGAMLWGSIKRLKDSDV